MRTTFTWTVGRKLTALAGLGLVISASVGAVAVQGLATVHQRTDELVQLEEARALSHRLDTRASELKVDAYKAVTYADPKPLLGDLDDDVATPRELLAALDALHLQGEAGAQVSSVQTGYETYISDISAFVKAAVADQRAMLPRVDEIQAANDKTDASLGGAVDLFTKLTAEKQQQVGDTQRRVRTTAFVALLVGLVALAAGAVLIARSITRPLHRFVSVLQTFAGGDLTHRVDVRSAGEFGQLEQALNESAESISSMLTAVAQSASAVASSSEELSVSGEAVA
ncbi:HAMP domain-containing protein, partial [Angustibacter peucedani]